MGSPEGQLRGPGEGYWTEEGHGHLEGSMGNSEPVCGLRWDS